MSGTVDIGRLLVRIEANQSQLRAAMADAQKQVASFAESSQRSVSTFEAAWNSAGTGIARVGMQALAAVAGVQAMAQAIGNTIKRADEAAAAQARIGTAIGSLAGGTAIYDALAKSAQQTGTSAADAAGGFARLAIAARQVGATNQQTLQLVTTMQRLAIISGASTQEAAASMQQFGQALASGKLQGDELRSLMENMPTLVEKLAQQLGVSVGRLREMGTEGKLTSDVVLPAMLRITQDVNTAFAQMPMTVARASESMSQAWSNLVVQVDRATGASTTLANVIKAASDSVQRMADRWVPQTAVDSLRQAREELERINAAQERIAARGTGTVQPEMSAQRRGGISTGLQRAAQGATSGVDQQLLQARREEIDILDELARKESVLNAQRQMAEQSAAAAAAAETARQRVLASIKEVTEQLGGATDKQRDQMDHLRAVVAEGDGALAKYGITAQTAASMLAAMEARTNGVAGAVAALDAQIRQATASLAGGLAGRIQGALQALADRAHGGDLSMIDDDEYERVVTRVVRLSELAGQAARQAADDETELARARARGGAAAESRARAEQNYRRNIQEGFRVTDAEAIRTAELTRANLQAAAASQTRLQPLAQVRQALEISTVATENAAAATTQGARAVREAAERDKARAEALKVARAGQANFNAVYNEFLALIQRGSRAEAITDIARRTQSLNDEIALIQREMQLVGELPGIRAEEMAVLRTRNELIASSRNYTEEEIEGVVRLVRAREQAREGLRQYDEALNKIRSTAEEISRDVATIMFERLVDGKKGDDVVDWFKALFKRIAIQALSANIILPITTQIVGAVPGLFGISAGGGVAPAAIAGARGLVSGAGGAGGASGTGGVVGAASAYQAGRTILGSYPGFSGYGNGLVGGGIGQVFNPGYEFNTGFGAVDGFANTPLFSNSGATGASMVYAADGTPLYQVANNLQPGMTIGQAGAGALGIAGGAYGIYSGLQTGGPRGYTQAAGGAVGVAGGAAGLAVAGGLTSAGGALAGGALGAAVAATAAWAPYIAAALAIAAMFMDAGAPTNAAAGAVVNFSNGAANIMNSGKQTDATAGARDQMVALIQNTTNEMSSLIRGIRPGGDIGFELGQRDPSRVLLNGQQIGSAAVGDAQGLANAIGKAILQAFASAPGLTDVESRILAASGENIDFARNLLTQTKQIVEQFGSEALNPDRNPATRAIYDAAIQTGNIEAVVAALRGAAELTAAYGDAINSADAMQVVSRGGGDIQKIVSDLQWLFQVYKPLTGAEEQVSALAKAIEASNKTYNDAIAKARELGLAEDVLAKKRDEAAEKLRQQVRDSYDAMMLDATGGGAVTQAVNTAKGIRANWNANALDYLAVGRDPNALYAAQMKAAFADLDIATLEKVVEALNGLDEVAVLFAQSALDAATATAEANKAAARLATAQGFDAQIRALAGQDWLNSIIEASNSAKTNAAAYADAGRDPTVLLAAQIKDIINGLDANTLATAAQNLQGLDSVTADLVLAAIQMAQASNAMADAATLAAQRIADAADYDAKMREALGLGLTNSILNIVAEVNAMASRYAAAGKDPTALANAQINAALQGQDSATLAKTAASLQGLNDSAASLAASALEQAIAAEVAAAQAVKTEEEARAAAQAQQDAARAQEQAARDASQAQQEAARASQQALEELARAGQNIKDYIAKLRSGTTAGYSPTDRLAAAQSQYSADLALAQQGNTDALGRITGDADALLAAAQAMYANGTQFQQIRDQIINQLNALPAVQSADSVIINRLEQINTSIGTGNSSLGSIGGNTSTTNTRLADANALLASIDTNNDGIVSIDEIKAAAQQNIKDAQQQLTTAAQAAATNTGATTTAVGGVATAVGGTTSAVNTNTGKADEVKGEITSNNDMTLQIKQLNDTLTSAATSSSGGFEALGTLLINLTRYAAAAAFNTMYSRPTSADPGISISSAMGNIFRDGKLITAPTSVPLSNMGEGGRPEAVLPLQRDPRTGKLGLGAPVVSSNDNGGLAAEFASYRVQSAKEAMALRAELAAARAEFAALNRTMQRKVNQ